MRGISRLVEKLLNSQEGLCSMELAKRQTDRQTDRGQRGRQTNRWIDMWVVLQLFARPKNKELYIYIYIHTQTHVHIGGYNLIVSAETKASIKKFFLV
jgi:hypothetical protein